MGSYDSYAEQYNGMVNSGGPEGSYRYIIQQLKNLSDLANLRICDIGCGQGELAYRLSELGAKVTGVDLSENLFAILEIGRRGYDSFYFRSSSSSDLTVFK